MADDFGANLAGTAKQTGEQALGAFDPRDIAGTQRAGYTSLLGSQMGGGGPTNVQDYVNRYSQAIAGGPSYTSLYNTANQAFNVPQLANQAAYLQNQVTNVAPTQYSLARGFDVSDPQVQNAINTNLRFLQPQATAATQQAQAAQNLAQQYVGYGMQERQLGLLPYQYQGQELSDALARQSTGFNIADQNELQGYVAKMNAGITLSQAEYTRANELLKNQTAYQQSLLGIQYQNVPSGNALVNTFTGGIINPTMLTAGTGSYQLR